MVCEKQIEIKMYLSAHGTVDAIIYNISDVDFISYRISRENFLKFFEMMDIWRSSGYDRFGDGGKYFELPLFVWDHLDSIPFIQSNIKITKIQ